MLRVARSSPVAPANASMMRHRRVGRRREHLIADGCGPAAAQNVMLEIKAKLEATRSSVASVTSTNATFAPVQRPETGHFARLPASGEHDSQTSAASYGTADLHKSADERPTSP